ncbi:helix-turn-helix domain-containing protein [Peribacillus sp. NPDC096448]|uniref:helix-turn-helix domain-containing protein n=1 Tax=Peribacillus sp. NPDC096448 TaxID=3364395 RepID=UPI00380A2ABB
MTFGEKLFKLRKEKGLSQEALAEKLNTTRQAVSKWENSQGFPETEKLLMIGNFFEVSMDYLLKDTVEQGKEDEKGFYVSKEMAEGFLSYQRKTSKYVALGLSLLILSTVPYWTFNENTAIDTFFIILLAAFGIVMIVTAISVEDRYKILRKEVLLLDHNYLKELSVRYDDNKKRYAVVMIVGVCLFVAGGIPFLLERKDIVSQVLVPYYPFFIGLIAVGVYILIRTLPILDSYKLLVRNEEHVNRLSFKLLKKGRKKLEDI